MIPEAIFITLLRDPVDAFESNYVYMGLEKVHKMDLHAFIARKAATGEPRHRSSIIGKNQLLWDLGVTRTEMEDPRVVARKIAEMDAQFDLVMMVERFEESLVLLQDLLCWPKEDFAFLKQNERIRRSDLTAEEREILRKWLWADHMLYEHFMKRLDARSVYVENQEYIIHR